MAEDHVFITGASGYVGRNLLRHFVSKGHPVTGLVRSPEAAERVASWGARPVPGDMLTAAQGQHVVILRPHMVWCRDDTTALPMRVEAVKSGTFAWISGGGYRSSSLHIANLGHAAFSFRGWIAIAG